MLCEEERALVTKHLLHAPGFFAVVEAIYGHPARLRLRTKAKGNQAAPDPFSTAGIVLIRILKSSHKDHLSIYCRSSCIHLSKEIELRPLTCHRQVRPGLTVKRRLCQSLAKPS